MNFRICSGFFILLIYFSGCKSPRLPGVAVSGTEAAREASLSGDHALAVTLWENYFSRKKAGNDWIDPGDFVMAAEDAYRAEARQNAVLWYDEARQQGYSGATMYLHLAEIFRSQDNLSREITALRELENRYPEAAMQSGAHLRLFGIYMETDRDKAVEQWSRLSRSDRDKESVLQNYFILLKGLNKENSADSVASRLLELNPEHRDALEWKAVKYYTKAESGYQDEMEKYNRKKTHLQYQLLINQLKNITEEFKKSRDYFETLWKIDPDKRYAAYLANIYHRLDNPDRALQYRKLSE